MQKVIYILSILFIFVSCNQQQEQWLHTDEGILLWSESSKDSTIHYTWEGETFENLVHGKGTLTVYKENKLQEQKEITAFYGSINPKDIKEVAHNGKYIGAIDENKNFSGYGVLVKSPDIYIGNFKQGKPNGYLIQYKNGKLYYDGNWLAGTFHGKGTLYKEDGSIRFGVWKNGNLDQTDVNLDLPEGKYKGWVKNNVPEGYGSLHYKNGAIYQGSWSKGKWEGEGLYISTTDSIAGIWKEGKLEGEGLLKSKNYQYEGSWHNDKPEGLGYILYADSTIYSGGWSNGKQEGIGSMSYSNGDFYTGDWKNGMFEGKGRYTYKKGDTYNGEWQNGLQQGVGEYKGKDFTYLGYWDEGWINGEGKMTYSNGDVYEGYFVENQRYGQGSYQFKNGNYYEGEFVDNKFNGLGVFHFKDGSRYEGEFTNGKIQGDGTLILKEGKEQVAITAYWDGSNKLPTMASILFGNGDLYEGELVNGFPTDKGVWSTEADRQANRPTAYKVNDFYKEHIKDKWKATVRYTSIALTAVEVVAAATGVGAPVAAVARGVKIGLNAVDAAVAVASAGIDAHEAIANGEDKTKAIANAVAVAGSQVAENAAFIVRNPTLATKVSVGISVTTAGAKIVRGDSIKNVGIEFGTEVATELAFIYIPKVLKSDIARKAVVKLSKYAENTTNTVKNSIGKIGKNKKFQKIFTVVKDKEGNITQATEGTWVGKVFRRTVTKWKNAQIITKKQFNERMKDPNIRKKLDLSKDYGDGQTLAKNMMATMGKWQRKILAWEKKWSRKLGIKTPEAHHIVSGNKPSAQGSRKILEKCGININDPRNGILLPMNSKSGFLGSLHGNHVAQYDDIVYQRLSEAVRKGGYTEEVASKALDDIKKEILKGNITLLKNRKVNTLFRTITKK